jgi:hypothetical protein
VSIDLLYYVYSIMYTLVAVSRLQTPVGSIAGVRIHNV